jgi:phospholipase/lecithinase/hemolysin
VATVDAEPLISLHISTLVRRLHLQNVGRQGSREWRFAGGRQDMKSPRRILLVTAAAAALALHPFASRADLLTISDMFVFGDSLSDGGNSGLLTQAGAGVVFPPSPYVGGRYTNGPTAVERLWNLYNTDGGLRPSLGGGTNFAIGGSTTGLESFNEITSSVPDALHPVFAERSAAWQLEQFQTYAASNSFDSATSLFVVWLFPNDVFYEDGTGMLPGFVPGSPGGANVIENGIANILTTIQILAAAGAQHFLVPNMANLADTPAFAGGPLADALSQLTMAFNTNLATQLAMLDAMLVAEITLFDNDAAFQRLLADPAAFGITNTTEPCVNLAANTVCTNPDQYLFWDDVHPTARAHEILAREMRRALVAEPGTLVLMGLGLLVIGLVHRRRRG